MALQWKWEEKIGEATIENTGKENTFSLYEGNAFLIMLYEYVDKEGKEMYAMSSFFADKTHARNCLGLTKGHDNIFDTKYCKLKKIRINKAKYSYAKDLVDMLVKAFNEIEIELYTE